MMELAYDGDLSDPKQRCRHGTFIGSWWGPDYLCPACECPHDDFDSETGECTQGCGFLRDGSPAPDTRPDCEYEIDLPSMAGPGYPSDGTMGCSDKAEHTLDLHVTFAPDGDGDERIRLCSAHMIEAITGPDVHDRDGKVWLDEWSYVVAIHLRKVLDDE